MKTRIQETSDSPPFFPKNRNKFSTNCQQNVEKNTGGGHDVDKLVDKLWITTAAFTRTQIGIDFDRLFPYNSNDVFILGRNRSEKEVTIDETDLSAEKALPCQGSWFPRQDGYRRRKKSFICKKS